MRLIGMKLIAAYVLATAPAHAGDAFRAGYELKLQIGNTSWDVQTMADLSETKPIVQDFGDYVVSMSVSDVTHSSYVLTVAVRSPNETPEFLLKETFHGTLQVPLEFASISDLARIEGAIALGRVTP